MKQKRKILSLAILGYFFLPLILSLSPSVAQASGCNYNLNFGGNTNTAAPGDTLKFTATVTESGDSQSCSVPVDVSLALQENNNDNAGGYVVLDGYTNSITFTQGSGTTTFSFPLGSFDRSVLPQPNQMVFQGQVTANSVWVTSSNPWTVNVSGAVGSSGALNPNIYFNPQKGSYNSGDSISVNAHIDSGSWANTNLQNTDSIDFAVYVNGTASTNKVGEFNQTVQNFKGGDQYFNGLAISTANHFQNGTNTVYVILYQSNTAITEGQGQATLQATGLASSNPNASNSNPNASTGSNSNPNASGGTSNCGSACTLYNPLPTSDPITFILSLLKWLLGVVGILAVVFIVIGGIQMITSQGNEESYGKAKRAITWAVIGLVVCILSFSMVAIVENLLQANVQPISTTTTNP